MRIVIDTNVLVSALLKVGSVPDRALEAVWSRAPSNALGSMAVLYDLRMAAEYRTVLERPKFAAISRDRIEELLRRVIERGTAIDAVPRWDGPMTDDDDRVFVEVALAGRADALVTGNGRHYPTNLGFEVLPPAKLLERLAG